MSYLGTEQTAHIPGYLLGQYQITVLVPWQNFHSAYRVVINYNFSRPGSSITIYIDKLCIPHSCNGSLYSCSVLTKISRFRMNALCLSSTNRTFEPSRVWHVYLAYMTRSSHTPFLIQIFISIRAMSDEHVMTSPACITKKQQNHYNDQMSSSVVQERSSVRNQPGKF